MSTTKTQEALDLLSDGADSDGARLANEAKRELDAIRKGARALTEAGTITQTDEQRQTWREALDLFRAIAAEDA